MNQSLAAILAALSLMPWMMKTGMSAAVAPLRKSRSRCQPVSAPLKYASPVTAADCVAPQPKYYMPSPKLSP